MTYAVENFPASIGVYTVQHNGQNYNVSILFDGDTHPEGHDFVVCAGRYRGKHPGELSLKRDLFFDLSRCCQRAREERWGYRGYNAEESEETPRQVAAKAAREVFNELKAWYHDEWYYVGVTVQDSQGAYIDSAWGIESTDTEYIREIVRDAIRGAEAYRAAREKHLNFLINSRGV